MPEYTYTREIIAGTNLYDINHPDRTYVYDSNTRQLTLCKEIENTFSSAILRVDCDGAECKITSNIALTQGTLDTIVSDHKNNV